MRACFKPSGEYSAGRSVAPYPNARQLRAVHHPLHLPTRSVGGGTGGRLRTPKALATGLLGLQPSRYLVGAGRGAGNQVRLRCRPRILRKVFWDAGTSRCISPAQRRRPVSMGECEADRCLAFTITHTCTACTSDSDMAPPVSVGLPATGHLGSGSAPRLCDGRILPRGSAACYRQPDALV